MERLTKRYKDHVAVICDNCKEKDSHCDAFSCRAVIRDRLAEYEDAEEQGLLVWLPCKEGTWVYKVCMISVRDDDYAMTWHQEMGIREVRFQAFMRDQFGKTVFINREDAEKALKDYEKIC